MTYELDHPGFLIRDSKGLHIVVYAVQRGLGMEVFPVDLIYRPWKNAEGQVRPERSAVSFGGGGAGRVQSADLNVWTGC